METSSYDFGVLATKNDKNEHRAHEGGLNGSRGDSRTRGITCPKAPAVKADREAEPRQTPSFLCSAIIRIRSNTVQKLYRPKLDDVQRLFWLEQVPAVSKLTVFHFGALSACSSAVG